MRTGQISIERRENRIKNKTSNGIPADEAVYYVALVLFVLTVLSDMSLLGVDTTLTKLTRYASYAMMIYSFLKGIYLRKHVVKYVVGLAVVGLSFIKSDNRVVLLYTIVIIASLYADSKKLIKVYMYVQLAMLVLVMATSQIGLTLDYINVDYDGRIRHFLGFDYTTTAPILFLFIIMEYLYLRKGRLTLLEYEVGMITAYGLYKLTDTTLAFIASSLLLSFFVVAGPFVGKGYITHTFRYLFYAMPWLFAVLSVWAQWAYNPDNAIWLKINDIVHNRMALGNDAIVKYGFTPFGTNITWVGSSFGNLSPKGYNYVDCSYLQIALQQGYIYLIIVLALFTLIMIKAVKEKEYYLMWITAMVLAFSMSEPRLMNVAFCPFVMIALTRWNIGKQKSYGKNVRE